MVLAGFSARTEKRIDRGYQCCVCVCVSCVSCVLCLPDIHTLVNTTAPRTLLVLSLSCVSFLNNIFSTRFDLTEPLVFFLEGGSTPFWWFFFSRYISKTPFAPWVASSSFLLLVLLLSSNYFLFVLLSALFLFLLPRRGFFLSPGNRLTIG